MADREVIQEFLVSLGFVVNEAGLKKTHNALGDTTKKFAGVTGAVSSAALAVSTFTIKMAESMERLYFQSNRTGESASNLLAIGRAGQAAGFGVDFLAKQVEGMVANFHEMPGFESVVKNGLGLGDKTFVNKTEEWLAIHKQLDARIKEAQTQGDTGKEAVIRNFAQQYLGEDFSTLQQILTNLPEIEAQYNNKPNISAEDVRTAHELSNEYRLLGQSFSDLGIALETTFAPVVLGVLKALTSGVHSLAEEVRHGFPSVTATEGGESIGIAPELYGLPSEAPTFAPAPNAKETVGERNHNLGNLRFAGQRGASQGEGGFARFASDEQGVAAMDEQLRLYMQRDHLNTLAKIIATYAPASDNNDVGAYIKDVSSKTGIGANEQLDPNDPRMASIRNAMIGHEGNGRYLGQVAGSGVPGGTNVQINQTFNTTAHGVEGVEDLGNNLRNQDQEAQKTALRNVLPRTGTLPASYTPTN